MSTRLGTSGSPSGARAADGPPRGWPQVSRAATVGSTPRPPGAIGSIPLTAELVDRPSGIWEGAKFEPTFEREVKSSTRPTPAAR
jgi:hypothetical protein